jgi:two-component system, NarL family, response regulator NreC
VDGVTSRPRLLLVDDHHLVLDGLRLELEDTYEIVGMLATGREVVEECERLQPDAVLLDLSLPDRSGLDVITDIRAVLPAIKILIVTMHRDPILADVSLKAGADGFVPKDAEVSELRHAIREILAGRGYRSPLVAKPSPQASSVDLVFRLSSLTPRQREIIHLLGEGMSTARIAGELHLSPNTVTFHRVRIRKALGIESEWGMMRYAMVVRMSEERTRASDPQ